MLDFTNSSDHGALKKTTNVKVLLDVLWPLFSVTSAPHGNFYVQVIQNFVYWFHFANISVLKLRWEFACAQNCYNLSFAKELLK